MWTSSKLALKEYKTRYHWEGTVILLELCKIFEFDKRSMNKPEYAQENEVHRILWDFETPTDNLIPTRRPDGVLIN